MQLYQIFIVKKYLIDYINVIHTENSKLLIWYVVNKLKMI